MVTAIIDFIPTLLKWVGIGLLGCLLLYGVVSVWLFFDKLFEKVKALEESLERFKSRAEQRLRVLENDNEFLAKKLSYLSNELDGVKSHTGFSAKQEVEEAANDIIKWA